MELRCWRLFQTLTLFECWTIQAKYSEKPLDPMIMQLAQIIVYVVFAYLAIGILFSAYFSFFAVKRFDESAKDTGIGFRLLIFPGVVALWVLFAMRILRGEKQPVENTDHRKAARNRNSNDS